MELTPEEKQRIYLEEKERIGAQDRIRKEEKSKAAQMKGIGCAIVALPILIFIFVLRNNSTTTAPTGPPPASQSASGAGPDLSESEGQVKGLAANSFLAKQAERNRQVIERIRAAKDSGNLGSAVGALRARGAELRRAFVQIENGDYSIADKTIMDATLRKEAKWVAESIQLLSSAP